MPDITPIQQSFSSGEITPEMHRRMSLQTRQNQRPIMSGVKEMRNFISDPRGPARSRVGFRYLGEAIAQAPPPLALVGFLYSDGSGSEAYVTETDYDSFEGAPRIISGFGAPDIIVNSGVGHAVAMSSGSAAGGWWHTTDGETWTEYSIPGMVDRSGIVWFNDRYIAVGGPEAVTGNGFCVFESPDGTPGSWTVLTTTTDRSFEPALYRSLATDGNKLLCIGGKDFTGQNQMNVSLDGGSTWIPYNIDNTENAACVFYANGIWFYSAFDAEIWKSVTGDFNTWTRVQRLTGLVSYGVELLYGAGVYIARIQDKTTLYVSQDNGDTWSGTLIVPGTPGGGGQRLSFEDDYGWLYAEAFEAYQSSTGLIGSWTETNLGNPLPFSSRNFTRLSIAP